MPTIGALSCLSAAEGPAAAQTIDPVEARAAFVEAKQLSDKEGGRLWGRPLYGPMLFVSSDSRTLVANEADRNGILHEEDGVWVGTLPPEVVPANTAVHWAGKHWTMVEWPLPEHSLPRRRLLAHELYHRLQDDLHLPGNNPQNPQLDTLEGRYWLQLEWRALAAALITTDAAQTEAIRDALCFRMHRHRLFAGSAESERLLELNEGLAEYTGYIASAPDIASAHWRIEDDLVSPQAMTFVRSFAYSSGPAYGMLLDDRQPAWRTKLTAQSDLGQLLLAAVGGLALPDAQQRALVYGGEALRISETERAKETEAQQARYRKLFVDGPTLKLTDAGNFNFSFDPNTVVPLPGAGNVNPIMEVTDAWGALKAHQGALLAADMKSVTVSAPTEIRGSHITGVGWELELAPGWRVASAGDAKHFVLKNK
ncbi:MAG TPA: hypothetical protein VHU83_07485 [Bryobacteraceae bacterium]|nr:hypothetical protein [Bryobacteraceae bacterium]